jgi:hypothetical protein
VYQSDSYFTCLSAACYGAIYFNHSHVLSVEFAAWRGTCLKFNSHISLVSLNDIKIRHLCLHARVILVVHVLAMHYHPSVPASPNSQLTYHVFTTFCLPNWKNYDRIWSSVNLSTCYRSSFGHPRHDVVNMTDVTSHRSINCRWQEKWRVRESQLLVPSTCSLTRDGLFVADWMAHEVTGCKNCGGQ